MPDKLQVILISWLRYIVIYLITPTSRKSPLFVIVRTLNMLS